MSVRPSHLTCAACEGTITATPFRIMGVAYCCEGCSRGGPCVCTYDAFDSAHLGDSDGLDGLGLPFRGDLVPKPEYASASARTPRPSDGDTSLGESRKSLVAVR